jgi:uncharacterized OB-fold protein
MMQGLTDAAFEQRFGAEDACLAALAAARQAAGMACPRCGNPKSYVYGRRVGCTRCNSPKHLPDYLGAFCWTTNHRKIIAALKANPNANAVARRIGGVNQTTVWKIAKQKGIELTIGRPTLAALRPRRKCAAASIPAPRS